MKCEEVRENFVESSLPAEAKAHMQSCASCTEAWSEHQKLFALLDEWQAPDPSPFFDTRLNALVREAKQAEQQQQGVLGWLRKPLFGIPMWRTASAGALALAMAIGISVMREQPVESPTAVAVKGTAVDDLQRLDKHQDEISNLELLDDLNAADNGYVDTDEL
jgi:hypothetical protein